MFGILDVEEAVRGVRVDDEIMDDSVERESGVEGSDVFIGDAVVSPAEEAENRGGKIGGVLQRTSGTVGIEAERAVIADYAAEAEACSGSEKRLAAAETKSECEDIFAFSTPGGAQKTCSSENVGIDCLARDAQDVLHVLEGFIARCCVGGAAKVIDGEGGVTLFGDVERQLFIEGMETANVGQYDDAGPGQFLRLGEERGKLGLVGRGEDLTPQMDNRFWFGKDGRRGICVVAHRLGSPKVGSAIFCSEATQSASTARRQVRRGERTRSPLIIIPQDKQYVKR